MSDLECIPGSGEPSIPTELVARLEAASVGSQELSAYVVKAALAPPDTWVERSPYNGAWCIYERPEKPRIWEGGGALRLASVTESLDAALALAERVLPGCGWDASGSPGHVAYGEVEGADRSFGFARAATAPLALCIAILKATTASAVGTTAEPE